MARGTPATVMLEKAQVAFSLHEYDYDPGADRVGLQAAQALGVEPGRVYKTLLALLDGKPVCAVIAGDREVAMKRLAAALGGKAAGMMPPPDAERLTGYRVGGISPFGQKRRVPVVIDAAALEHERIFVNGGRRGLQVQLDPAELVRVLAATVAAISA